MEVPLSAGTGLAYRRYLRRKWLVLAVLAVLLAASCIASACAGSSGISPLEILRALFGGRFLGRGRACDGAQDSRSHGTGCRSLDKRTARQAGIGHGFPLVAFA